MAKRSELPARHPLTILGERLRDSERVLIATALYARSAAAGLVGALTVEDLRSERLGAIWSVVERLAREGQPVNELEVVAAGLDMAHLDEVQGLQAAVRGSAPLPALRSWRAARAAMRGYGLLDAAQAALAHAPFTAEAVAEATSGLVAALALVNRELVPERANESLLDAWAEYVRSTRAGQSRQVVGSWGLPVLDERLGSLRAGTMHVVAAFPGHGKSTLGLTAARATASRGGRVLYVTTEMLREELTMRVGCAENGKDPRDLERSIRNGDDLTGHATQSMIVAEDRQRDIDAIAGLVRAARQADKPFAVVVLDYLQMLKGAGETEYERLSYIAYRIKSLALDEGVSCVVMAQVNRTAQADTMPSMRSLRGSSAIEDAADAVVMMRRMDRTSDVSGKYHFYPMGLRIDKARNGTPGDVSTDKDGRDKITMTCGTFRMEQPNAIPDATYEEVHPN